MSHLRKTCPKRACGATGSCTTPMQISVNMWLIKGLGHARAGDRCHNTTFSDNAWSRLSVDCYWTVVTSNLALVDTLARRAYRIILGAFFKQPFVSPLHTHDEDLDFNSENNKFDLETFDLVSEYCNTYVFSKTKSATFSRISRLYVFLRPLNAKIGPSLYVPVPVRGSY